MKTSPFDLLRRRRCLLADQASRCHKNDRIYEAVLTKALAVFDVTEGSVPDEQCKAVCVLTQILESPVPFARDQSSCA